MTAQNPSEFPLPPDLEGFWQWDKLHCPRPLAPLEHELLLESTSEGFSKAMGELGSTLRAVTRSINYYNYLSGAPRDLQGEDLTARLARYDANVTDLTRHVGERWEKEWLPAILPVLEHRRNDDYARLNDAGLLREFDAMRDEVRYRWYVHGMLLYSFFAAGVFADFYKDALQAADEKEGYEALQGFPSMALESSRGLWRLSRVVRADAELRRLFEVARAEDLVSGLEATETGRSFRRLLDEYLADFGWRADSVYELRRPSWREDPSIPLNAIQGYVSIGDDGGPDAQFEAAVRRREQLLAEARRRLGGEPAKLARFNELYESARSFTPIVEDHNHYIDQMGDILMRYPALELGRRLAARGSLAASDDVFLLRCAEIGAAMNGSDLKELAAARRAEMEHFARVVPPLFIGPPPPPSDDPIVDVIVRFFGVPVEPSADPAVITGIAASPGTARGPARVVRDLAEASKVSPGDVLVCEMTLPPWTPLFSTACAVVADTGGILSHCAIVARENRIPCVVGTAIGTTAIRDGMILTVDGSRGIVRIEQV